MASSPQKSPSTPKSPTGTPKSPPSRKKDDSFLGKLGGTLARRKKAKEVSELQEEGINAINLPLSPVPFELDPEDTMLEKLEGEKLNVAEVTQSEIAQKQKLQTVLEKINDTLKVSPRNIKWNVDFSELQEEGINAINLPLSPVPFELDPEDTMLEENEVRTMVDPNSRNDPRLQELMKVLIDWINDVLVGERIIVKDVSEDLYDGQVLQKLFEKLEGEKLNVAEVTQSEIAQKQKLQTVLEKINDTLKVSPRNIKWNVDCT
ncbi:UNVERIFIED_CONTAM: hypothetical protein FKN15_044545 [Acipenser sinensis]